MYIPIMLSISEKAYLAGIIDADGCISIDRYKNPTGHRYKPRIQIIGDRLLMDWLNTHIQQRNISVKHEPFVLVWSIQSKKSISELLEDITPYLTTKKERAIIVKKLCDIPMNKHDKELRESIYQEYKTLINVWHDYFKKVKESTHA